MITIEETKQVPWLNVLSRSPVADLPLAKESVESYIQWSNQVFTVKVDEEIVAVWGVIRPSILSGEGYLWLLPTNVAEEYRFMLVRHSQRAVAGLLQIYTALIGECTIADHQAKKWLRLLGAKFDLPGEHTIPFRIERKQWPIQ